MKSRTLTCIIVIVAFATLALSAQLTAQSKPSLKGATAHHRYRFVDLNTLGGPNAGINCCGIIPPILNNRGTSVGSADTSRSQSQHSHRESDFLVVLSPWTPDPFINVAVAWHGTIPDQSWCAAGWI